MNAPRPTSTPVPGQTDAESSSGVTSAGDFLPVSRRSFLGVTSGSALAASLAGFSAAEAAEALQPPVRDSLITARNAVESNRAAIIGISREVWRKAAVGLKEAEAMEVHLKAIEQAGFKVTQRQAGGHPTAFVAEWKQGTAGPVIGFLPEYDALPGLGNAAEPALKASADGNTDGHGCGHNALGAGCTGGAMALRSMMLKSGVPGTVRIYGCGAEETEGAKPYMVRAGLMDDLDAALSWHSGPVAAAGLVTMSANRSMKVAFKGKTAHAGNSPWEGRSALDAMELFAHGLNLMREHVQPTARIHYIYEVAGLAPNIVPDDAQMWLTIREKTTELVLAMEIWVRQLAEGAAMGTQTKVEANTFIGMAELIPNEPLARRMFEHLSHTPLDWTPEEQAFAKACQKSMGVRESGLATKPLPFVGEVSAGGSTDVGDVSWVAPVGQFVWPTLPQEVSLHTWAVTACGGMSIGDKGSLNAAIILAATGYDLMTEPTLLTAAREDLKKRLGGRKYVSALPPEQKVPLGTPGRVQKTGDDEITEGVKPPAS